MKIHRKHRQARQSGFGLVEAMVGVVISLMATLAIFQTFALNEEQRRTTSSGSEGLQAGTLALAQVQKVVRNAGYNLVTPTDPTIAQPNRTVVEGAGVSITNATPVPTEFMMGCITQTNFRMAPIVVTVGANAAATDTITVMEGNSAASPIPAKLVTTFPIGSTDLTITSTYGYALNDWVLVYEQAAASNPGNTRPVACTLARVSALPSAPVIENGVVRLSVGTAAAYSADARVVNLGQRFMIQQLSVDTVTRRLMLRDLLRNTVQVLADNVLNMKVQAGIDIANDDLVDEWINPPALTTDWINPPATPVTPAISALPVGAGVRSLNQIKALRVGLLIRSPQFERPAAGGTCQTTAAGPFSVLPANAGSSAQRVPNMPASASYSLTGDARCYRYNTVTSVMPLRNVLMSDL